MSSICGRIVSNARSILAVSSPFHQSIRGHRPGLSEYRKGHVKKTDDVEGEKGTFELSDTSFDFVNENLMDKMIDNVKFKDIPVLHIVSHRNNTKIVLTSPSGPVMVIKTAGTEGFKNCRKGTTVAAETVAQRVTTMARELDVNMVRLVFKGLGPGRNAAYKVVEMSGLKIVSLSDRTEAIEPWIRRPRKAKRL